MEINKVYHGDCMDLLKEIPNNYVDLIITSPPYNMRTRVRNGEYTEREKSEHFSKKYKHFHDALSIEDYYNFHKKVITECLRVSKMMFWNIQIVTGSKEAVFKLIGDFNKEIKDIIVWDKGYGQPAMHDSVLNKATELIIVFENNASAGRCFSKSYFKRGTMEDIWRIKRGKSFKEHSACFPEELVRRILKGWSKKGDLILDPFAGSGTTLRVAQLMERNYLGFEIAEEYIPLINKRLQQKPISHFSDSTEANASLPPHKEVET